MYPPRPSRKHRTNEAARAASNGALVPHRFRPGVSGDPAGFPKGRREQLELIEACAREASPEMIEILKSMARHSADERVRVMAAKTVLEFVPRQKEYDPDEEACRERARFASMSAEQQVRELRALIEWAASLPEESDQLTEVVPGDGVDGER